MVLLLAKVEVAQAKSDDMLFNSLCTGLRICWCLYEFL